VVSFEVRRMVLRTEMKQRIRMGLPQEALAHFAFSKQEYEALDTEDGGREFRYGGHLYDVVRTSMDAKGVVHVDAVDDQDEARLMAGLEDLLRHVMARSGMDRERARLWTSVLPSAMPERPLSCDRALPEAEALERRFLNVFSEGAPQGLLRPPRA
jgi:hypothetical protein